MHYYHLNSTVISIYNCCWKIKLLLLLEGNEREDIGNKEQQVNGKDVKEGKKSKEDATKQGDIGKAATERLEDGKEEARQATEGEDAGGQSKMTDEGEDTERKERRGRKGKGTERSE
jgi:hypothetical protein